MKKTFALFAALALLLSLAACGQGSAEPDFEPEALTGALMDSDCFTDLLSKMEQDVALELYGIDTAGVDSCSVYLGTGATAEEIAVFRATSADAAKEIAEALSRRIDSQITAYENYVPAEVPKLEAALVCSAGLYAVYVTAADADGAQKIVDEYMK